MSLVNPISELKLSSDFFYLGKLKLKYQSIYLSISTLVLAEFCKMQMHLSFHTHYLPSQPEVTTRLHNSPWSPHLAPLPSTAKTHPLPLKLYQTDGV